ncbi:MAG: hypothetical protein EA414_15870 [Arthrospira sp. PLM2.Bin9]|nr:MAG: hypothetical protein EA414_15870 [Arthrospira sp. PLM2.Bin9]
MSLRFTQPTNLRNGERSHNLVGWVKCNVTQYFTRLCWVALRFTQPTTTGSSTQSPQVLINH